MPTYRYTGDAPTVFVGIRKDGHTWEPSHGDTVTTDRPVGHPLLERVAADEVVVRPKKSPIPAEPEDQTPIVAEEIEEK